VFGAEIVSGQNTLFLGLRLPKDYWGESVTASLEVRGLPEGCANTASETFAEAIDPGPELLDEFSPIGDQKFNNAKAAAIARKMKDNPNSQLYLLIYFRPSTSAAAQAKQVAQIRSKLTKNNQMDPSQVTVVKGFLSNPSRLKIYLVPPGVVNPQP